MQRENVQPCARLREERERNTKLRGTWLREERDRNAQLQGAQLREDEIGMPSYGAHGYVKTREERPTTGCKAT